ncbi:MAG: polysaccharide biosynthesis protein, partial [Sphingopyxis sp.]
MFERLFHAGQGWLILSIRWLAMRDRLIRQMVVIGFDMAACALSVPVAFWLRLGQWTAPSVAMVAFCSLSALIWMGVAVATGVYRSVVRFSGARTLMGLAVAATVHAGLLGGLMLIQSIPGIPRTVAIIQPLVMLVLVASGRLLARYILMDVLHHRSPKHRLRRIMVYGAGMAGQQVAGALQSQGGVKLAAFVDDDARLSGRKLDGTVVYGPDKLADVVNRHDVTEVILAMPSAPKTRRKEIVAALAPLSVRVSTLPDFSELLDGKVSLSDLHEIDVVELLGRDPVDPDRRLLGATVEGRTVMITGAGGSIGSEVAQQVLRAFPRRVILVEMTEFALFSVEQAMARLRENPAFDGRAIEIVPELANCTDGAAMDRIFNRHRPDTVFHAAAYKHVPLVEQNPVSGVSNNVFGTLVAAQTAEKYGVSHFILISTDKAVRPTSLMGASKRVCELVLQAFAARGSQTVFAMVRFGNVLGSSGSVVPLFRKQIAAGGPVTVTDRAITRYFMTIPEAAQLVIQASGMAHGGDVFLLDMGDPVRIVDLAESMIRLSGLTVRNERNPDGDIEIVEVGLRPGEKLFEELLIDDAAFATDHSCIFRANEQIIDWPQLSAALERLRAIVAAGDGAGVRTILLELV